MTKKKKIIIYTDGACSGNPGMGGWGAILRYNHHEKEIFGGELDTTNNRMELRAAIESLNSLKKPSEVEIHTDSQYVKNGITKWIKGWKERGWKTAARKPVKNVDLWQDLEKALLPHDVSWYWVKGHAGHDDNERADELARAGIKKIKAYEIG